MARASTRTLLPLDRFTQIVNYSPILFNQVQIADGDLQPASSCSDPILQYTWQARSGGRPGREEIALAIAQAEEQIEQWLGFAPAPKWYADENVAPLGRGPLQLPFSYGWSATFPGLTLRLPHKHLISGGFEDWALIKASSGITYTDPDGDGYNELATVVVALPSSVTSADEIAVYYPRGSVVTDAHDPTWEVRPVRVDITSTPGIASITFMRHQVVLPDLLERLNAQAVDGLDAGAFLTSVDVYRHFNNPSQMATVEWAGGCVCGTDGCGINAQTACMLPVDKRNALVRLSAGTWNAVDNTYNGDVPTWCQQPRNVRAWYRAGYQSASSTRPLSEMALPLARAITFLALANLDRDWEACENIRDLQSHWRTDLAARVSTQAGSNSFQLSRELLDNPFGTTRAAVYAWSVVSPLRVGEVVMGT